MIRRGPRPGPLFAALIAVHVLSYPARANHGPGTSGGGSSTASGETLRAGGFDLTLRTDYTLFENVTHNEAIQRALTNGEFDALDHAIVETVSLSYGVTDDFQVGVRAGYYWGSNFVHAEDLGGGVVDLATADPHGATELWIDGKLRVLHGPAGHLALLAGVKLPTGKDNFRLSNGAELEPSSQPATGSVDGQLGIAYSRYLSARTTIDTSAIYTIRTEHEDFEVGDRADVGLALSYRLTEDVGVFPNWSFSAELLGAWLGKDTEGGNENPNSGGTTVYAAPGVRVRFDDQVALSLAPAFPVLQDLNGDQDEGRFKAVLTLSLGM